MRLKSLLAAASVAALALLSGPAQSQPSPALRNQALEILTKGIAFKTVAGSGQVRPYAEYLKGVLVEGGFAPAEVQVEDVAGSSVLVARYPGADRSKKPIVVLGHMDVVEARREDWERDPFTPVVENGYVFGRGALDNKFEVSMAVATLANLRRQGWRPGRDVVLALTGDEETQMRTTRVLAERLKNAELVLNADAGGGQLDPQGKPIVYALQAGEKTYGDFRIVITDPGGHSSRPTRSNAIYRLTAALQKLAAYQFPAMQNELTRAYFQASAKGATGPTADAMRRFLANPQDPAAVASLSALPEYVGQVRTTCVATQVNAGHAPNALPQRAEANINCRIFPGVSREQVRQTLIQVIADPSATVTFQDNGTIEGVASPLRPDVLAAVSRAVHARYPGLTIVPTQSAGATDSMHFRAYGVPAYGVGGIFIKPSDVFAHGLNERAPVAAIEGSLAHWDSLLKDLAK